MAENKRCSQDRTGRSETKEPGLPSEDDDAKPNQAVTALQRLGKRLEQRAQESTETPPSAKVLKLPLWPEAVRGVPNVALRSALFGAIKRGPRRFMDRELVTSLDGCEIRYTGGRLD